MRNAFVRKLTELAEKDPDIMLVTGDLGFSVFDDFQVRFPKQYINAGLSEQSMIGMAAGLAMEGKKVFVYSIIPFLIYRPFEQIRNDLCYANLPVKLVGVGSGLTYGAEGGTHHATEDFGVMTSLPNMQVFAPGDPQEVEKIMEAAVDFSAPCYIRLSRANDPVVHTEQSLAGFNIGSPCVVRGTGNDFLLLATGNMLPPAVSAWERLDQRGCHGRVVSIHALKPFDPTHLESLLQTVPDRCLIVTLEEHTTQNGLASLVHRYFPSNRNREYLLSCSLQDDFVHEVGSSEFLRKVHGVHEEHIAEKIRQRLGV